MPGSSSQETNVIRPKAETMLNANVKNLFIINIFLGEKLRKRIIIQWIIGGFLKKSVLKLGLGGPRFMLALSVSVMRQKVRMRGGRGFFGFFYIAAARSVPDVGVIVVAGGSAVIECAKVRLFFEMCEKMCDTMR